MIFHCIGLLFLGAHFFIFLASFNKYVVLVILVCSCHFSFGKLEDCWTLICITCNPIVLIRSERFLLSRCKFERAHVCGFTPLKWRLCCRIIVLHPKLCPHWLALTTFLKYNITKAFILSVWPSVYGNSGKLVVEFWSHVTARSKTTTTPFRLRQRVSKIQRERDSD